MGETRAQCPTQAQDLVTDTQATAQVIQAQEDMAQVQAQEDMALDSPRDGALQSTVPHADIQAQPPPPAIQQASQDQGTAIQAGSQVQDMAVTAYAYGDVKAELLAKTPPKKKK